MITVRWATEADIPAIHALIAELAVYERAPDAVEVSLQERLDDFRTGHFECFVAHDTQGAIVGIALFCYKYSTWKGKSIYLEDIVVTESHRRQGIGSQLFAAVGREAARRGVRRLAWQVLDWNTPAIEFYNQYHAELDPTWINGILTGPQLAQQFGH